MESVLQDHRQLVLGEATATTTVMKKQTTVLVHCTLHVLQIHHLARMITAMDRANALLSTPLQTHARMETTALLETTVRETVLSAFRVKWCALVSKIQTVMTTIRALKTGACLETVNTFHLIFLVMMVSFAMG
jgi:hypothetical protein